MATSTANIRFSKEVLHNTELGKLEIPNKKIAAWINFLTSPKQHAQIISAEQQRSGLILYFQAPGELYAYLDHRINEADPAAYRSRRSEREIAVAS
jgi:hypothetical protein